MRQRTAPPVTVVVHRYALWRAALLALGLAVALSLAAWATGHWGAWAVPILVPALLLGLWGLAGRHWGRPGFLLRWDGQDWHWRDREQVHESRGRVIVRIDLGDWMLLQLVAHGDRRTVWLPLQRAGLESRWHALRCAVYSPTRAADPLAGSTPSTA
ncbi:hypothetical protein [Caldimonas sp.]|uniref:hypothetical protein n=1 Tax=Caldimonas sp. TaxID=2838790 RepID=UPI00391B8536